MRVLAEKQTGREVLRASGNNAVTGNLDAIVAGVVAILTFFQFCVVV